jgi:hypothetical protein
MTWYRSRDRNGRLWCESRDPEDVLSDLPKGYTLERLEIRTTSEWVPWDGDVPHDD